MVKKSFHLPVLSDLKESEFDENDDKGNTEIEERKLADNPAETNKSPTQEKKIRGRSLTDEEYEEIFEAVLQSDVTDKQSEDENGIVNNEDIIQQEDANVLNSLSAQEINESTPVCSDEESRNIPSLPPPPKKKKHFATKRNLSPKQLDYLPNCESSGNWKKRKQLSKETTKDRLLALQQLRLKEEKSTWVQCCNPKCCKWRCLKDVKDPSEVPVEWFCNMNSDPERNTCDKPEEDYQKYEFVYTKFVPGSIVWAKVDGYPWWPAMVEDDPDTEEFVWTTGLSEFPTFYHVVFFDDKVTRAWVRKCFVKLFTGKEIDFKSSRKKDYSEMIEVAYRTARKAAAMNLEERLKTFSFGSRYKGRWPKAWNYSDDETLHNPVKKKIKDNKKITYKNYTDDIPSTKDEFLTEAESILEQLSDISSFSSLEMDNEDESTSDTEFNTFRKNKRKIKYEDNGGKLKQQTKKLNLTERHLYKNENLKNKVSFEKNSCLLNETYNSKLKPKFFKDKNKSSVDKVKKSKNVDYAKNGKNFYGKKSTQSNFNIQSGAAEKTTKILNDKLKNKNINKVTFKKQSPKQTSNEASKNKEINESTSCKNNISVTEYTMEQNKVTNVLDVKNPKSVNSTHTNLNISKGHHNQRNIKPNKKYQENRTPSFKSAKNDGKKKRITFKPPMPTCESKSHVPTGIINSYKENENSKQVTNSNTDILDKNLKADHKQGDAKDDNDCECSPSISKMNKVEQTSFDSGLKSNGSIMDHEVFDLDNVIDFKDETESQESDPFDMEFI